MSLCSKRKQSKRPARLRFSAANNVHTWRVKKKEGVPWTHSGKSRLRSELVHFDRTTGHVAGGTMFGGS